jgi:hypothetical protein
LGREERLFGISNKSDCQFVVVAVFVVRKGLTCCRSQYLQGTGKLEYTLYAY